MKLLKDILSEVLNEASDQTKIFDQGSLNDIEKQIRKEVGILKDETMYDKKVEYSEFRFSDGTGGFYFKWSHNRNQGGRLGVSLRKDGNHKLDCQSWYGNQKFGDENIDPKKLPTPQKDFLRHIRTWKDLNNLTMQTIVTVLSKDIKKNEAGAQAALDAEAKGQAAHYGAKSDTGRIGYGLSSQPRRGR